MYLEGEGPSTDRNSTQGTGSAADEWGPVTDQSEGVTGRDLAQRADYWDHDWTP